jgi:hypothetical protein
MDGSILYSKIHAVKPMKMTRINRVTRASTIFTP